MGRRSVSWSRTVALLGLAAVLGLAAGAGVASATTLIMPDRDALITVGIVVWGNTTQANGTAFSLDCGDGSAPVAGSVADQSYITRTCTYAAAGTFTAKLTVGAESATAKVTVHDPATTSAFDLRGIKVNMAIEDGLRFLYQSQFNRAAAFAANIGNPKPLTSWRSGNGNDNFTNSFSSLAIQAIQNHGHPVNGPATDIFQPVVQAGLNWVFDKVVQQDMTPCNEGGGADPCINVPAPTNIGLRSPTGDDGYTTSIMGATVAGAVAVAPARTVAAGLGANNSNFVAGKTYAEILQRMVNVIAWGQSDGASGGGWTYGLEPGFDVSDGSTLGWAMLALIDAEGAGATIPAFVKPRVATALTNQLNADGSLSYQLHGSVGNPAKTGIGLQSLFFTGAAGGDPRVTAAENYLSRNWNAQVDSADGFSCDANGAYNKNCGYAMFNAFKGLKLYGVQTLPGVGRPAGPPPIPANDWYADYVDNLLANQHGPNDPAHGEWTNASAPIMGWSCCFDDTTGITALAELILAPLIFPVATLTLAPDAATNPVGGIHTVTATALTAAGSPVPGVTVTFTILSGPNAGDPTCAQTGTNSNITDANGNASCTYADLGGAGTDQIQASIPGAQVVSNIVTKTWALPHPVPTLSEWGYVVMAGLLALVSLWALRRRKGHIG